MNPAQLLAHFNRISDAPNAVPRLRRFVLDLALRGKLVEQDLNDEPAIKLLNQIRANKRYAAKAGTTKKPRDRVETDEFPFSAPSGWEFARIGEIADLENGDRSKNYPSRDEYVVNGIPFINAGHLQSGSVSLTAMNYIPEGRFNLLKSGKVTSGDILFCLRGSLGKSAIVKDISRGAIASSLVIIRFMGQINPHFVLDYLFSSLAIQMVSRFDNGTAQPNLSSADLEKFVIPLPPLAEQHRIVAKVDELMALCDRLEAAQAEREGRRDWLAAASLHRLNQPAASGDPQAFREHASFHLKHLPRLTTCPEHIKQLRQAILNLAVRGQLVPQDPNDEPASELLKRIRTQKRHSVSDGKRKRDPDLPAIDFREAPFNLPIGWTWARFPELGTFGRGKSKHRPRNEPSLFDGGTHLLIQTGDVARSKGIITTYTNMYNEFGLAQSLKWPKGTLCITIAANIADSGILSFDACFPDSVVGFVPASEFPNARYFEYFIRTAKANFLEFAPATAQKNINLEILNAVLIPLPPLAEQHRIVAKVDELMALCDRLEAQLATAQSASRRLLESVLHQALSDS
jgi:type I restriction enzyme S subunit